MRAILIDPFTETVTEVEYDGDYRSIYKLLSHPTQPVNTFTVVQLGEDGETLFVDDNGLLNEPTHFFMWRGYPQPLAGKALILGTDDEGESVATKYDVDNVKELVTWANNIEFSHMESFEDTIDHPILGPGTKRIGNTPVFITRTKQ